MRNTKKSNRKMHVLWRTVLAGVLSVVMTLSGSLPMPNGLAASFSVHAAEADNSIINWDGLPQITEEKVQTEAESGVQIEFTHPGIFTNKENLDLMRQMIHEGYDPWFSAFEAFREDALASKDYENTNADRTHTYIGNADRQDANAAYMQSVMWWVTGDKDYYDNAVDIIRSYSESYDPELFATEQDGGYGWSADIITTGMVINKLTFAAEILRYATTEEAYENAWTDADTENFSKVLEMAYPLYDRTDKWMNQTAFTFQAMIASAVFQDDPNMYELVIERATVNDKAAYHFADASIKWQARLVDTTVTLEDFNDGDGNLTLINPEEPVIQWAEMGRDQPHALAGLSIMSGIAQTAYVQGTEVNENGQIVNDGSGTNLFEFLDHRLLKGANYYYQFNLGYDVTWYPLAKGNESEYTNCPPTIGANNDPGWYTDVSNAGRFTLGGSGVLYYHYLYKEGLSKDDSDFKYVVEAQELQDDTGGSGDAITNASLLLAPIEAKTGEPQGPPKQKEEAGYAANIAGSGRIQATDYSGAYAGRMPVTSTPSSEYYTDDLGIREVTNNNYKDDYIWFQDVDFGDAPLNSFMLTSASNSGQGTLFKVVLLDNVDVQDWSAVTRAEIDSGEVVAEGYSGGTGWWSTYRTKVFTMSRGLSGKHSFAFLYLGSDNVYDLAANVDWMAFGNSYAYENNTVKDAPIKGDVTVEADNAVLGNGSYFGWNSMNMDIGNSGLTMDITSQGVGKLHLYEGTPEGEHSLVATYDIPYTGGVPMTVRVPGEHFDTIKGNHDVYYVYEGATDLKISSICSYYQKNNNIPTVQGEDYALVKAGEVTKKNEDEITYAEFKDGGIAFYRLNLSGENLSFRVRTNGNALLTLTSGMDNNGNITNDQVYNEFGIFKMEIPNTNGRWAQFQYDLSEVTNRSNNVYLMVTGADVDIDYIASGGDNSPAEITNFVYDQAVFSVEKDGAYTDYLLAGQNYNVNVETFDFDNDSVATMVVLDRDYVSENGSIQMNIAQPGAYEALVVADDGSAWTLQTRNLIVVENIEQLIQKVGAYDTLNSYSTTSMNVYREALEAASTLGSTGYTAELVEALERLSDAAADLIMLVPTEEDGQIDYINYADYLKFSRFSNLQNGYSEDQEAILTDIRNLTDNSADTYIEWRHSQNNTPAYFMMDFTEGMGVKLSKFTLQSRQGFGSRTNGVLLEASVDGENWVTISANGAANSNNLQTISIKSEHADVPFRYIRLYNPRVNESGANSFLSIAEFHLFGEVVEIPAEEPTEIPSEVPTEEPTEIPSEVPTEEPTETPSEVPTEEPTVTPTEIPTVTPTEIPTEVPTEAPTEVPTVIPTETPTEVPTVTPTETPTEIPTEVPTVTPTETPTEVPTVVPTEVPTVTPTETPTEEPTVIPTEEPTVVPTETPSEEPTEVPTVVPTEVPTVIPTEVPTEIPTVTPTEEPTVTPTETPTEVPTEVPTVTPTETPTEVPTEVPTVTPTETPTEVPTEVPTVTPTEVPTELPTEVPTTTPTETPTQVPGAAAIAAPKFVVKGVINGRDVTFNCETEDAVIYYSTTTSNLTLNDAHVNAGETVTFSRFYGTVYARAYVNGQWSNASRLILKIPVVNTPTITSSGNTVTIKTTTPSCAIYYTTDGSTPSVTNGTKVNSSTCTIPSVSGTVRAIAVRSCFTNSDVASQVLVTSAVKVSRFGVVGVIGGRKVTMTSETAGSRIYYSTSSTITTRDKYVENGGSVTFENFYGTIYARTYSNGKWSNVSRFILKIPVVNTPTIEVLGSGKVKIKTTTPSCTIYYTTDGSTPSPTNGHMVRSSSTTVTVGSGKTVKAIAVRSCFTNSNVTTARSR